MGQMEITGSSQALAPVRDFSAAEMDVIKTVIARGASDVELKMFVAMATKLGLDPLSKQIYCVKRHVKQANGQWVDAITIVVGIDGYRLAADRTGRYCPGRAPTYEYDDDGRVTSATAYVLKLAGGAWHEVSAVAFWDEYAQTNKEGAPTAMWVKMPRLMLGKCAEALALRRAFPAELSGVYTEDEMAQAQNDAPPAMVAHPVVNAPPAITAPAATAKPHSGNVGDAMWKMEISALGVKAKSIIKEVADLPDEQRERLVNAMKIARDVLSQNGSSTADHRAFAISALKRAIGIEKEKSQQA